MQRLYWKGTPPGAMGHAEAWHSGERPVLGMIGSSEATPRAPGPSTEMTRPPLTGHVHFPWKEDPCGKGHMWECPGAAAIALRAVIVSVFSGLTHPAFSGLLPPNRHV